MRFIRSSAALFVVAAIASFDGRVAPPAQATQACVIWSRCVSTTMVACFKGCSAKCNRQYPSRAVRSVSEWERTRCSSPSGHCVAIGDTAGWTACSEQCGASCQSSLCQKEKIACDSDSKAPPTVASKPEPAPKSNKDSAQPSTRASKSGPAAKPASKQPVTASAGKQPGSGSCGPLKPGDTAVHECSARGKAAPPPGAMTVVNKHAKGPTTTAPNGQMRTCYGWNAGHNQVATDCSAPDAFIFLDGDPSSSTPEPSIAAQPDDQAQPAPVSPPPRPVRARAECPETDQYGNRCVDITIGSEPKGDWTEHRVEIENRCDCTCHIGATDKQGQGRDTTVEPHSKKTDLKNKIICNEPNVCTGFQPDVTYSCHR